MNSPIRTAVAIAALTILLTACGGGGGGGGTTTIDPPPAPTTFDYSTQLTTIDLTDRRDGSIVTGTGLPIDSAVATRTP